MNDLNFYQQPVSLLEMAAMLTGIAGVWLTVKKNIWCFPTGIVNVSLYAWLFFTPGVRLYADALLQCFYILLLIYGWMRWYRKISKPEKIKSEKNNSSLWLKLFFIFFISTSLLAIFLQTYTSASWPWLDSALTCASLIAQWMIAKKIIENWIIWIIVDIIYIPLYMIKQLPLTAILYAAFLFLAIRGYAEWKKNMKSNVI